MLARLYSAARPCLVDLLPKAAQTALSRSKLRSVHVEYGIPISPEEYAKMKDKEHELAQYNGPIIGESPIVTARKEAHPMYEVDPVSGATIPQAERLVGKVEVHHPFLYQSLPLPTV